MVGIRIQTILVTSILLLASGARANDHEKAVQLLTALEQQNPLASIIITLTQLPQHKEGWDFYNTIQAAPGQASSCYSALTTKAALLENSKQKSIAANIVHLFDQDRRSLNSHELVLICASSYAKQYKKGDTLELSTTIHADGWFPQAYGDRLTLSLQTVMPENILFLDMENSENLLPFTAGIMAGTRQ
jgi:hypothetical protein